MKNLKNFKQFSIKESKEVEINKEDEDKYLTDKQKTLPDHLKKSIIEKAKKEEKK